MVLALLEEKGLKVIDVVAKPDYNFEFSILILSAAGLNVFKISQEILKGQRLKTAGQHREEIKKDSYW